MLIASTDQAASEFMQSSLSALSQYDSDVKGHDALLDKRAAVDPTSYDLLVFDAGDGSLLESSAVQELRRKFAALPLIVVSDPLTDRRMRLLLKLNGNDWVRKPLDRKSFLEAVTGNVQMAHSGGNHVHAVISAVGGAGGTSVAISLADALVRMKRKTPVSVALFDLDFATGACGHYLNTLNDYDLQPVIANPSRVRPGIHRHHQEEAPTRLLAAVVPAAGRHHIFIQQRARVADARRRVLPQQSHRR